MKQVIIIRRDLKMRRGKEIAQGAHASMGAYNDAMNRWGPIGGDMGDAWDDNGRKKVVLKVDSEEKLLDLTNRCMNSGVGYYLVRDHGKTEVEPNTPTALGVGPAQDRFIDEITGELELY